MKEKSSAFFRLDEQVYLTMGAVALISFIVFSFRAMTHHPCQPIILHIQAQANSFEKGNIISFKAETTDGKNFAWNFGDGTVDEETDPSTVHKYSNAGKYTATVTVNGECSEFQNVVITEASLISNMAVQASFIGPDTDYVNQPATYAEVSTTSTNWEWHFEDPNKIDAITKSASHIYKTPGLKKIMLMVNGRKDLVGYRYVYVIDRDAERIQAKPKENRPRPAQQLLVVQSKPTVEPLANPTQPPPTDNVKKEEDKPKPKAPEIAGPQMENLLMEVIQGTKRAEDFSPYLCNNLAMNIYYNSSSVSFVSMCENLKGLKKKKVKKISVKLYKDGSTNCINYMIVIVEIKKGIFGL
jgi:hypothetical protein